MPTLIENTDPSMESKPSHRLRMVLPDKVHPIVSFWLVSSILQSIGYAKSYCFKTWWPARARCCITIRLVWYKNQLKSHNLAWGFSISLHCYYMISQTWKHEVSLDLVGGGCLFVICSPKCCGRKSPSIFLSWKLTICRSAVLPRRFSHM